MSKQRLVETCFWDDSYIIKLDPSEKLLFLYMLTNPLTTICGVYEISIKRISFDTGFEADTVQRILSRFERDNRCIYRNGWLAMRNWIKHQTEAPGVKKGIELQLARVPEDLAAYVQSQEGVQPPLDPVEGTSNLNLIKSNLSSESSPPAAAPSKKKAAPDPRIKLLIDYFFAAYKQRRGYPPTCSGGVWGKIFQRLLRQVDQETIEAVIDAFFDYDKRTRFSIHDFDRSFDNVYGHLYDKVHRGKGGN